MTKIVDCGEVNPAAGCSHVVQGATEEEVLRKAREHARKDHGLEPTPELMDKVKSHIKDRNP